MRIDDLRMFVAIAEAGSLVHASERLRVSQPTLSKSIARLEGVLKVRLVERHARGVRLTDTGKVFLSHAQHLAVGFLDAQTAIRERRQGLVGKVKFGVGYSVPQKFLAAVCNPILRKRDITIEMSSGMADALFRFVIAGDIEFAVVGARPVYDEQLQWTPLFEDPMVPYSAPDHTLAQRPQITWDALAKQSWLLSAVGTFSRTWFDRQFTDRDQTPPTPLVVLQDSQLAFAFCGSLNALFLAPASLGLANQNLSGCRRLQTPEDWRSDRTVGILRRRRHYMSASTEALVKSLVETASRMFPPQNEAAPA